MFVFPLDGEFQHPIWRRSQSGDRHGNQHRQTNSETSSHWFKLKQKQNISRMIKSAPTDFLFPVNIDWLSFFLR